MDNQKSAICVENVSKIYPIGLGSRVSLRHESGKLIRNLFTRHNDQQQNHNEFHALQDINFEVAQGESLGIIGPNGAGKTTLLRLLASITRPTTGTIQVNGRFTALIGLGGGFNQDLTGRQNIFLSGAIYGVSHNDMMKIVDDIIDFAEIDDFIDSPVREYSSGMRARLGFSVAVKLLPEIIFIDEILSVGDESFKQKSQDHMFDMLSQKKTIVFVSHALDQIQMLCQRVIWLDKGQIKLDGPAEEVVKSYRISIKQSRESALQRR